MFNNSLLIGISSVDMNTVTTVRIEKIAEELIERLRHKHEEWRKSCLRIEVLGAFRAGKSTLLNSLLGRQATPVQVRQDTRLAEYQNVLKRIAVIESSGGIGTMSQPHEDDVMYPWKEDSLVSQKSDPTQAVPMQIRNEQEYQCIEAKISAIERLGCKATPEQIQTARELSLLIQQYEDKTFHRQKFDAAVQSLFAINSSEGQSFWANVARQLLQFRLSGTYEEQEVITEAYLLGIKQIESGTLIKNPLAWLRVTCLHVICDFRRKQDKEERAKLDPTIGEPGDTGFSELMLQENFKQIESGTAIRNPFSWLQVTCLRVVQTFNRRQQKVDSFKQGRERLHSYPERGLDTLYRIYYTLKFSSQLTCLLSWMRQFEDSFIRQYKKGTVKTGKLLQIAGTVKMDMRESSFSMNIFGWLKPLIPFHQTLPRYYRNVRNLSLLIQQHKNDVISQQCKDLLSSQRTSQIHITCIESEEEYQSIEAKISAIERLGCQATPEQIQAVKALSLLIQQYEDRLFDKYLASCKFEMN